jgi:hypothetical protein
MNEISKCFFRNCKNFNSAYDVGIREAEMKAVKSQGCMKSQKSKAGVFEAKENDVARDATVKIDLPVQEKRGSRVSYERMKKVPM